jgi:hypothetical protein
MFLRILLICVLFLAGVFILGGFLWQALDYEMFPDESLPRWFVWLFRKKLLGAHFESTDDPTMAGRLNSPAKSGERNPNTPSEVASRVAKSKKQN